jgi:glyoxylase-like metal-dependent hydrolase (beta-lactamase superfamily II)
VVVGRDAVLVVDTRGSHRQADELRGHLAELGGAPVRWVVNTHGHFDHCFGNARFRPPHGDADLWGHDAIVPYLAANGETARRAMIAADPDHAAELEEVEIVPPDHLVDGIGSIDLGDREVRLHHVGRGHTDNDLVLVVPDAAVVFAGDLVEESAPPAYGDDAFPLDWPATATRVVDLVGDGDTVVPGHGDVVDRAFVDAQRDGLVAVAELVRDLHDAGVPVDRALVEAGDRWPWPPEALANAVGRGYAQLDGTLA